MSLALDSCPGGIVLSWSKYAGSGFVRYVTLKDTNPFIPPTYNASKVLAGTSTTSSVKTTADDPAVSDGGTYFYRTLVLASGNKVLQASPVESGLGFGRADLGPAAVGGPVVAWGIYKRSDCFSQYDVLYYLANPDITPTAGHDYATVGSRTQTNADVPSAGLFSSGDTVWFRIEVVRKTSLGSFVVGETTGSAPSYTYP